MNSNSDDLTSIQSGDAPQQMEHNQTRSKQLSKYTFFALLSLLFIIATSLACAAEQQSGSETPTELTSPEADDTPAIAVDPFTQIQPLGDGKVVTTGPKKGYVYSCTDNFRGGGASHTGDWIDGDWWDPAKKVHVQGDVDWPTARVAITTQGASRTVTSNDLPDHHTGIFPISKSDPAYAIDPNPNAIGAQEVLYTLPVTPTMASTPFCTPRGPVGIMTNGVLLFNALDDAGRDAVAHEVQDKCDGHPQAQDAYHYHGFSPCFESVSAKELIGYALDGFGITGPRKDDGSYYSTDDLDECHGTTSTIIWDGNEQSMYHYVMTADYPYSIGCFKGAPVQHRLQ